METREWYTLRKVKEDELTLPRLIVNCVKGRKSFWIEPNPFCVYANYESKTRIPVYAEPTGEPIILSGPNVGSHFTFGDIDLAVEQNILTMRPKDLDPFGFAARKYVLENKIGDPNEFAYDFGYNARMIILETVLVPAQLYHVKPKKLEDGCGKINADSQP